mgnify:CR=1 FL=1
MVIDILFCLLIFFNAILGIKKGFFDAVFEFIDIGVGIFFALAFYIDSVSYTHLRAHET